MTFKDHPPVLRNITFAIPPKTRVALIGESGAGKSTLGSLARSDFDPSEGDVLINGKPFRMYNRSSVLAHMGVILQQSEVISSDVRENILFSVSQSKADLMSDDDIWNIIDMVSPNLRKRFNGAGLDTKVGTNGLRLSGGERQRLCVMRALIKNPEFLIIDEATSALDSKNEEEVQQGIDTALSQGISALVIAHRFSTLRNCDRYVVLKKLDDCEADEPQIEAICDSLKELYGESPTFRRLANLDGFQP